MENKIRKNPENKRGKSRSQDKQQRAPHTQPLVLDVEVLEERIAPGFLGLSGGRLDMGTRWIPSNT